MTWISMIVWGCRRQYVVQHRSVRAERKLPIVRARCCSMMPGLCANQPKELAQICAKASKENEAGLEQPMIFLLPLGSVAAS